jgi:hypothetical protein
MNVYSRACVLVTAFFLIGVVGHVKAQDRNLTREEIAGQLNALTTAVPFLMITPDSRSAAMGDVGVAISPDANSIHWNASKLVFSDIKSGFGISYAPWLRNIVPDVHLSYITGYSKISDNSAVGGSFRWFSLGQINFTDVTGDPTGSFEPNEFAIDGFYATKLSEDMSLAVSLRFIYSNLLGTRMFDGMSTNPGLAGAGDVSWYYKRNWGNSRNAPLSYAFGAAFTNLGSKITYTTSQKADFIPMNLRVGTSWNYKIDEFNEVSFSLDLNKLMVPTQPVYDINNPDSIIFGKNPKVPVLQGAYQSFFDAPGGFREELSELMISAGVEYWYAKQFALRGGYFHEAENKGGRKYFTVGAGFKMDLMSIDAAYLVPVLRSHPLQNQLRFSLLFDIDYFKSKGEVN